MFTDDSSNYQTANQQRYRRLNNTINQKDLVVIDRTFHPKTAEYAYFPVPWNTHHDRPSPRPKQPSTNLNNLNHAKKYIPHMCMYMHVYITYRYKHIMHTYF